MSDAAQPVEAVTVFIGSVTAGRQRSFLVACSTCGGGYYLAARTVREMRQTGRVPVCRQCRRPDDLVNITPRDRAWALAALADMTPSDRELVALGLRSIPRSDLALAASGT